MSPLGPAGRPRKRIPVRGTLAGSEFRGSVYLRASGDWEFITGLDLRGQAGVGIGDTVDIEMVADTEERTMLPPPEVATALAEKPGMRERWDALPWSHQREYVLWFNLAKRPETRARRAVQIADLLARGAGPYRER